MTKLEDNEPALLLAKCDKEEHKGTHLNEQQVVSSQMSKMQNKTNICYLDNGASSHMTGYKSKFVELNYQVRG